MLNVRRVTMDHKTKKLLRKVQISASIDPDALRLLTKMAADERRSVSGELNTLIYAAAEKRYGPVKAP